MGRKRPRKMPKCKNKHCNTPQKTKVQIVVEYLRAKGIPEDPRDVFEFFDVKEQPGYKLIEPDAPSHPATSVQPDGTTSVTVLQFRITIQGDESGAAAVQWLHVQYLKRVFVEKLTSRFPSPVFDLAIHRISITAPIIPSYHLNLDGHDSKYLERRHGSVQPIPPIRFFHRESRTLHRERAEALGSYRWPSDQ
ncbi:MAG: hypothetical protein ASARMPRED_007063 [Alectoria sarmentosa]|nr:MAG: hypothetical protein ASARMPRED_007063 [Alectoria sarmentosa]